MKTLVLGSVSTALFALLAAQPLFAADYTSKRPPVEKRLFRSAVIDKQIQDVQKQLTNPYLSWMFGNCFPNTLDTTVHYEQGPDGKDDTFVYTGDIHAMWLRDSAAQVWPYLPFMKDDPAIQRLIRGVVLRQFACIRIDPYANAFNKGPTGGEWQSDMTKMKKELHERKYEIDSLCYPVRLAYAYWRITGDTSIFDAKWEETIKLVLKTFRDQQRKTSRFSPYTFQRRTAAMHDTVSNHGHGHPANPVGLIASTFRPSDDCTIFPFLVPSNFFAVDILRKASVILKEVNRNDDLAKQCAALSDEVADALQKYAVVDHPKYGKVYAFEVDGFGSRLLMDDANAPSLLALPYLCGISPDDPVYRNTRKMIWSADNPYFFKGRDAEGIGSPHTGYNNIWPMSLIMRAMTSSDDAEIKACLVTLLKTDAGTGFMHESFDMNNAAHFSRSWFAWANTHFGELILKLVHEGKLDLLNSLPVPNP
ncbi:MAG: glycoside hydrolase family 125 protein [Kiritimatiellae bacterium]|nr:glycoside hydrolase family 125 protein [Kiritimatiellia bacterium]